MTTQYTRDLESRVTVNGVDVALFIDGTTYAPAEYVVGRDYWIKSEERVHIVIESARRKQADFLARVCAIYRTANNDFYILRDADLIHAGSEANAFRMAQDMADQDYLVAIAA